MVIKQTPFRKYNFDDNKDTFTIKLNREERQDLDQWKFLLQQEKDSTAIKQLATIGAKVLLEDKVKLINEIVVNNYRKNKRAGIVTFD